MTPQTIQMTPKQFFPVAEMKILLIDPKNGELGVFLRKFQKPVTCFKFDDVIITPQMIQMPPKRFFLVAEMKLLLFHPKNDLLVAFLRKSKIPYRAQQLCFVEAKVYTFDRVTRGISKRHR